MSSVAPAASDRSPLLPAESSRAGRRPDGPGLYLRALARDPVTLGSLAFILVVVLAALGARWIAPHDPIAQSLMARNLPPGSESESGPPYRLGTDFLGRDQLSRLIYGARVSLSVGFISVAVSGTLGVLVGLSAGYFGGRVDSILMRIVDIQMAFPTLLLALVILYAAGASFWNVILVIAVTRWMIYARVARSQTLTLRESPFVEAVRALGCPSERILRRHLLPNISTPLLVLATLEMSSVILTEASLDFLGLGIQPPESSWGLMLSQGRQYMTSAWWLVTFPGLAILFTTLAFNLVATWLRAVSDPVQRWRWIRIRPPVR